MFKDIEKRIFDLNDVDHLDIVQSYVAGFSSLPTEKEKMNSLQVLAYEILHDLSPMEREIIEHLAMYRKRRMQFIK